MVLTKTIKLDVHDGEAVAAYLSGYLGARPMSGHKDFFQILETFPYQGHNFLVLALRWFYELSKEAEPDYRCEASVELAREVYGKMDMEPGMDFFRFIRSAADHINTEVTTVATEISAVVVLVYYLSEHNASCGVYDRFIQAMLRDHPTIRQSFTRLIMDWCRWVDQGAPAGSKSKTVLFARAICSCDRALPYI